MLSKFFSKWKRGQQKQRGRHVAVAASYQELEKRQVLTSLTGADGPVDVAGNPLASIYLNRDTKILYIHAQVQNPNLPGLASDISVTVDRADGDIIVSQIAGSAGLLRDVPGLSAESLLVNSRRFYAGSIERIIYKGSEGNDRFQNRTQINARIAGRGGDDYLVGGGGQDRVIGGDGNDRLFGGRNDDVLIGGDGDDWLSEDRINDNGNDRLIGGNGDDRMAGGVGDDFIMGGNGNDVIGKPVAETTGLVAGPIIWSVGNVEAGIAESGNDRIFGNAGNDTIYGGLGSDRIYGGAGDDQLHGGASLSGDSSIFAANVQDTIAGGAGHDTIVAGYSSLLAFGGMGNDRITGSAGQDRLIGHAGNDILTGLAGDDFISGGNGHDILRGGAGSDRINGGAGEDQLHGDGGADKIFAALPVEAGIAALGRDQIFGDAKLDFILRDLSDTLEGDNDRLL